ncbi:MAG: PEP-CTERM sorting domain-containing protein [Phycisphaerae bacterium]|nr:PEP-CTERM sorting domain-containing protein [Phycisphaerae bacterium]
MKKYVVMLAVAAVVSAMTAHAATVAYWRFEEGPANANVPHPVANGVFYPGVADSSGNGYALSVWAEGWAGYAYKTDVAGPVISGQANNFSVKNTGGYPAMFTEPDAGIQFIEPAAFTIEATFKLENGGYKTIVGRDSRGTATINSDLAALYFQAVPNNGLAIKFCDVSGYWHEAIAPANSYIGFDWSTNPDGLNTPWYSMAAVSDGSTLSLYLRNVTEGQAWQLIAQTDMTQSGSSNTALTKGLGSGGDWVAGTWSVGRGLYAGGHGDRAYGFIDEVRISDAALSVDQFLMVVPEPATLLLLGMGSLLAIRRKQ